MNNRFFKIYYIVAGVFIGLSLIYYLIRLYDLIFIANETNQVLKNLNLYAFISIGIALAMMILAIPLSKYIEKKENEKGTKNNKDQELLAKYKTKKLNK